MTVDIKEASVTDNFELAEYGASVIKNIKKEGLNKVAKEINALVLNNPYVKISCPECKTKDNYTIDDLVTEDKKAKYNSNFVVCSNCNKLISLL